MKVKEKGRRRRKKKESYSSSLLISILHNLVTGHHEVSLVPNKERFNRHASVTCELLKIARGKIGLPFAAELEKVTNRSALHILTQVVGTGTAKVTSFTFLPRFHLAASSAELLRVLVANLGTPHVGHEMVKVHVATAAENLLVHHAEVAVVAVAREDVLKVIHHLLAGARFELAFLKTGLVELGAHVPS